MGGDAQGLGEIQSKGMIRLQGVGHSFGGAPGRPPALKDVDLTLERGEAVAVMGANGSGKSTLARCLNGLLIPDEGVVSVDGPSTRSEVSLMEIRRRVGMLFQEPSQQLVTWSVADEVAFGPRNLGMPDEAVRSAVESELVRWDLEGLRERRPADLSAGQRTAVAVASVMAMRPSYMVVDEPSSLLDRRGRAVLREAMGEIKSEGNAGVMWVTQFPEEAMLFDRLVVLCGGRVVADGDPAEILPRRDDLNRWGIEATPATLMSRMLESLGRPLARVHVLLDSLIEELRSLGFTRLMPLAGLEAPRSRRVEGADGPAALRFDRASFGYDARQDVLRDVSLALGPGDCLGIAGPSGSGKTTLSFLAAGAYTPTRGAVIRESTGGPRSGKGGPRVGIAAQLPEEQFCVSTVEAEVELGLLGGGMSALEARKRVERSLQSVGLDPAEFLDRSPLSLSEGEKRKVALASALALQGALLVLDEPTLGLDGPSSDAVLGALGGHLADGGSALVSSHSGDFLFRAARRLLLLSDRSWSGPIDWNEALVEPREGLDLPEGQLPELGARLGGRPAGSALGALDELVLRFARRLAEAVESRSEEPRDRRGRAGDGTKRRARPGKCS
jgi:energy-coupling factor transporter ATP-binding protein EcfA2